MSDKILNISRDDERLDVACRWVLKFDSGSFSSSDEADLSEWLDASPKHREYLLEAAEVWDKTDTLARLAHIFPHEGASKKSTRIPSRSQKWQGIAVAASIIFATLTIYVVATRVETTQPLAIQTAKYATEIGKQKVILLPDGSEVVLNTNSQLIVKFTPTARLLQLVRGEIHVKAAEDASRPLSVIAGEQIVQAVGTEFTVEITEDEEIELIVTEGKVVVGVKTSS